MTTTTVGTSLTTIVTLDTGRSDRVGVTVTNGDTAFNACQLQGTVDGVTWVALASDASGFSTPLLPLRRCIGAPVTLADEAVATLLIDGGYFKQMRLQASVASGTSVVEVEAWTNR